MNDVRFDAWTRSFASRRGAVRTLVGIGAALAAPRIASAGAPLCDAPGSKCDPDNQFNCCSGICKKHKRKKHKAKFKCAPAGEAFGCTKHEDFCTATIPTPCPDNPAGFCIKGNKRKPLCFTPAPTGCAPCKRDSDCTEDFGPIARCIKGCAACKTQPGGFNSACIVPAPPPV